MAVAGILTELEVLGILRACSDRTPSGLRNRALIAILASAGLRASEVLALTPPDVVLSWGELGRRQAVRVHRGVRVPRVVPFERAASLIPTTRSVEAWLAMRKNLGLGWRHPLFCTISDGPRQDRGRALQPSYLRHLVARLGRRTGLQCSLSPSALRHFFAAWCWNHGATVGELRVMLGHEHGRATMSFLEKLRLGEPTSPPKDGVSPWASSLEAWEKTAWWKDV